MSYLEQMRASIRRFEQAEQDFARITARYGTGLDSEYMASRDANRRKAQGDAAYYNQRAQMYALAHLAEQTGSAPVPAWPYDPSCAPEGGVYRGEVR